jgi:hypothetical protein
MSRFRTTALMIVALLVAAFALAGTASAKDRNNDRIPDRWEKHYKLSLKVNQARRDQDKDGLNNRGEFRSASDPRSDDTDDDGVEDGDENAGVITEFDGTTLTIELFGGGTVTGTVDDDTEVKCGDDCDHDGDDPVATRDGNSGPGSANSGPGNEGDDDEGVEEDHHGHHHGEAGDDDDADCSIDDLAVGVTVHEAELELENGSARFEEIELADE